MTVNEARRAEGVSSAPDGDTVQQAVNMAPLDWVPARGGAGDQGSNQAGVPGEAGHGDLNRNPADDPAPGDQGGGGRAGVRQFECRLQPESTRCEHTPSKAYSGQNSDMPPKEGIGRLVRTSTAEICSFVANGKNIYCYQFVVPSRAG
jgi:hypothetical protein